MKRKYKCKDGTTWIDTRLELYDWVHAKGGQFASLVDIKSVNGVPTASIRTMKSWEPVHFPIPDDILMTLEQCKAATQEGKPPASNELPF